MHEGENIFGRQSNNQTIDIPLITDDMKMSRKHFNIKVQFVPEINVYKYTLEDMSANGTSVNKMRINGARLFCKNEDTITASRSNVTIRFMN